MRRRHRWWITAATPCKIISSSVRLTFLSLELSSPKKIICTSVGLTVLSLELSSLILVETSLMLMSFRGWLSMVPSSCTQSSIYVAEILTTPNSVEFISLLSIRMTLRGTLFAGRAVYGI